MESGLNNLLKRISSELFIKHKSTERTKIQKSLDGIIEKLEDYFDDEVEEIVVFGSYTRGTILPRRFDEHSDIDILIQFNVDDYDKLTPESYRTQLQKFAKENYKKAFVIKDHPSIVLELKEIKFDLVPSLFDEGYIYDSVEIPNKYGGWMETDPGRFNEELTKANKKYKSIVKPIIRLMKYWNACQDYPFSSYELEKNIAGLNFRNDNFQNGFLYAAKNTSARNLPGWAQKKVDRLKSDARAIEHFLEEQDIGKAKEVLECILPGLY